MAMSNLCSFLSKNPIDYQFFLFDGGGERGNSMIRHTIRISAGLSPCMESHCKIFISRMSPSKRSLTSCGDLIVP